MGIAPASLLRASTLMAGLWAGALWAIALIGTPAGFALVAPDVAGRLAGRMLQQEAYLSLALAVLLIIAVRRIARADAAQTEGSLFSANLVLAMVALFCTVLGYFGLQPMMAAARAGQGTLSFGALHGISMGLFGLKALAVTALAWRLTAR